jgi:hypothetical protein
MAIAACLASPITLRIMVKQDVAINLMQQACCHDLHLETLAQMIANLL